MMEPVIPSSTRSEVIPSSTPSVLWALLFGNFVIGSGMMVVPGTLNERPWARPVAAG